MRAAPPNPDRAAELLTLLSRDTERSRILDLVHSLDIPDCWIGAGFIRNAVWDHLHGRPPSKPAGDVDVIWFDPRRAHPDDDSAVEKRLIDLDPDVRWSVKNQARMHTRNDDSPYTSATDAMRFWPETATAVAMRRSGEAGLEIAAPFGLDDLFDLILRPTPRFSGAKHDIYLERARNKQWLLTWPRLLPVAQYPEGIEQPVRMHWTAMPGKPTFTVREAIMSDTLTPLTIDFLTWLAAEPRDYFDVMDAWRTSCPRLTVWEDAIDANLITRVQTAGQPVRIGLTPSGQAFLASHPR